MRPTVRFATFALAALSLALPAWGGDTAPIRPESRTKPPGLVGVYSTDADSHDACTITAMGAGVYQLVSARFSGVGFFDGREFAGVVHSNDGPVARTPTGAPAWIRAELFPDDRLEVTRWVGPSPVDVAHEVWRRTGDFGKDMRTKPPQAPPPPSSPPDAGLPKFGEYVRVEMLPEAITKVPPDYPADARQQGIEGTVLVQVLIGRDGLVKDTKVVKSNPALDAAAVTAVQQWRFKPAVTKGEPVAVWVAVPIGFHLK
jgi:TonB family protein